MNGTNEKREKPQGIPWIKSPNGTVEIYANLMHVTWSLDDVRLRLAHLTQAPETPNPGAVFKSAAEELGAVTFSWRSAKVLRDSLTKIIESYEMTNGEIKMDVKLPPNRP